SDETAGPPPDGAAVPPPPVVPRRRRHRRATGGTAAPGTEAPDSSVLPRSPDASDAGWGDAPESNDDRLRRDVPPHW
ncbi:hypothetical protein, partial [Actinotalea sp. JY-7885]